nr:MAG TPA: hypothetical protein [Caudoviricetes sp.]
MLNIKIATFLDGRLGAKMIIIRKNIGINGNIFHVMRIIYEIRL